VLVDRRRFYFEPLGKVSTVDAARVVVVSGPVGGPQYLFLPFTECVEWGVSGWLEASYFFMLTSLSDVKPAQISCFISLGTKIRTVARWNSSYSTGVSTMIGYSSSR